MSENSVAIKECSIDHLIQICHEAKTFAYTPYNNYRVGAALLTVEGKIFTGCNVENASSGIGICAERTAVVKAVSNGYRKFKAIAVSSDDKERFITPCGACRQFLIEFGNDYDVYMTKPDGSYLKATTKELLPHSFEPYYLGK